MLPSCCPGQSSPEGGRRVGEVEDFRRVWGGIGEAIEAYEAEPGSPVGARRITCVEVDYDELRGVGLGGLTLF